MVDLMRKTVFTWKWIRTELLNQSINHIAAFAIQILAKAIIFCNMSFSKEI